MSVPTKPTIALEDNFHFDQVDHTRSASPAVPVGAIPPLLHTDSLELSTASMGATLNTHVIQDAFNLDNILRLPGPVTGVFAPLGDLLGFTNPADRSLGVKFAGVGFNTIFRPQSSLSIAQDPITNPIAVGGDNILELNLTRETLSFAAPLGNVPNRGSGSIQADIFLNAVPYTQSIEDITFLPATGIHFEPGMWLAVPTTVTPPVKAFTYTRMASIPHGVTINAQGTSSGKVFGAPTFPAVNINPFFINGSQAPPSAPFFPNQTAATPGTARIPQDLTPFILANKITQAMIDNPNSVLTNQLAGQTVTSFVALTVTTDSPGDNATPPTPVHPPSPAVPSTPGVAGGINEIGFLRGDNDVPQPSAPNAHAFKMVATFWIETIAQTLTIPHYVPGSGPLTMKGDQRPNGLPRVTFTFTPPGAIHSPKTIIAHYTQIQYSQVVFLNFQPLTWPHCSVATLVPTQALGVPASAFS